jgi:hypothetical protein
MRLFLSLILVLIVYGSCAQANECFCSSDSMMNECMPDCKQILLKNGAKLYWQFNCDKIWLTLELRSSKRITIDTLPIEYYPYFDRLGYQFFKEFAKSLLFRSGCPANGPCNFVLLDKTNGKKLKDFGELIYDHDTRKIYNFLLYLSSDSTLILHYIGTNKRYKFKIDSREFNEIIPEYMFNKIAIENNLLRLQYGNKTILVNLNKYTR